MTRIRVRANYVWSIFQFHHVGQGGSHADWVAWVPARFTGGPGEVRAGAGSHDDSRLASCQDLLRANTRFVRSPLCEAAGQTIIRWAAPAASWPQASCPIPFILRSCRTGRTARLGSAFRAHQDELGGGFRIVFAMRWRPPVGRGASDYFPLWPRAAPVVRRITGVVAPRRLAMRQRWQATLNFGGTAA